MSEKNGEWDAFWVIVRTKPTPRQARSAADTAGPRTTEPRILFGPEIFQGDSADAVRDMALFRAAKMSITSEATGVEITSDELEVLVRPFC